MSYAYLFKFLLLGDSEVGTTSLLLRYTERRQAPSQAYLLHWKFSCMHLAAADTIAIILTNSCTSRSRYAPTVGIGFGAWITTLDCDSGETQLDVKLQIWDTPPGQLFRSLVRPYYTETAAALLVYDVTRRDTFEGISGWLSELRQLASPSITCALVGNKSDLEKERQVSTEEGAAFAAKLGMLFFETTTRDVLPGHHAAQSSVDTAFESTAAKVLAKIQKGVLNPASSEYGVKVGDSDPRRVLTPSVTHAALPDSETSMEEPSSKPAPSSASATADAEATKQTKTSPGRQVLDVDPAWLLSTKAGSASEPVDVEAVRRPRSLSEAERACIDDAFVSRVGQAVVQIDFQSSRVCVCLLFLRVSGCHGNAFAFQCRLSVVLLLLLPLLMY